MKLSQIVRRFFVPGFVVTLVHLIKSGARVSHKAEVELSPNLTIGSGTTISSFCKLKAADGPMAIGTNVAISTNCFIYSGAAGVSIGDDTMLGPGVSVIGGNYRYDRLDIPIRSQEQVSAGIRIGKDVWIGAGVVVLDGVTIGDGSIIAPNSVVSSNIPENRIARGDPAHPLFQRR